MSCNKSWIGSYATKAMTATTASALVSQVCCQVMTFVASGIYTYLYISSIRTHTYTEIPTKEHTYSTSAPHPQIHNHVIHNYDCLNATAKRKGGGWGRGSLGVRALCKMPFIKEN